MWCILIFYLLHVVYSLTCPIRTAFSQGEGPDAWSLDRVKVFTVDCGEKEMVKPSDLSNLPDSLGVEMFPPATNKVLVGSIIAMDIGHGQELGGAGQYVCVQHERGGRVTGRWCAGGGSCCKSDTVWLDRCQVMVRQPTLAKFVCTFETVCWLAREGFATITKNHMEVLYKIAEKAGFPIPEVREESLDTSMVEEGVEVKSRTAFLPQDEVVTA